MRSKELYLDIAKKTFSVFEEGKEYIRLTKDDKHHDWSIYVSESGLKQSCYDYSFKDSRVLCEEKVMVAFNEGLDGLLTIGKEYSVYQSLKVNENNSIEKKYLIVNDNFQLKHYSSDCFMDIDEYSDLINHNPALSSDTHNNISIEVKEYRKKCEENNKQKELEEQDYKQIRNILKAVSNEKTSVIYPEDSKKDLVDLINKFAKFNSPLRHLIFLMSFVMIAIGFLLGLCDSLTLFGVIGFNHLLILFGVISFFILVICNLKTFKVHDELDFELEVFFSSKNYHINVEGYHQLSLETLGKIKYIEQQLSKIKENKVSEDILALINKNIQLIVKLCEIDSESSDVKLSELLDEVISYNHTLIENKEIEEKYIKEQLAQNIHNVIEENKELFKSMAKDNHYLTDYLKNDEPLIL